MTEHYLPANETMLDPCIKFNIVENEIIRIDTHGFHYRGQFIEDAGEAHRLLVEFLRKQKESN